ncbi:MAG TPA: endonuclease/exonuclease/phosphatase family protein, partial [Thermoanaerobaculia bacterium]|nr:endonuclease/exonuclease/phosphatase family protein [Thermoanaerobaculia bacterium]
MLSLLMKSRVLLVILLLGCSSASTPPGEIRVLVYNIHAGRDAAGVDNLVRVTDLIRSTGADLVLLQEVDRGTTRSGNVDQLARLEELTGLRGVFGKSLDYQGGQYGIAVLSRWPIRAHRIVPLPNEPPQPRAGGAIEPRIALEIETNGMKVVNTHLDASREETYRLQEVDHLLPAIVSADLIGGDFNAEPQSTVLERVLASGLRDAWALCGSGPELTYPDGVPVKRIDYLFLSPRFTC